MARVAKARSSRTGTLHVRLTEAELAGFSAFCTGRGVTLSEGARRMVRAACGFGPTHDHETRDAILELAYQTRAIGVNLNQAVKALNRGKLPSDAALKQGLARMAQVLSIQEELYRSLCGRARDAMARAIEHDADVGGIAIGAGIARGTDS
ncbi:hypothetical protein [Rhizobium sp. ZPR3]|uniref:Plasmid mobilization relaxosome protein MobC n=2 Tax=unclassified Rhizobium TaxID=2613769 RepID=A0AAU7SRX4_9HYPH